MGDTSVGNVMIANLTSKEKAIVNMLSKGSSYKQIAESMSISPRTVEWHVGNVARKTQCHSRIEIVEFARQAGLLGEKPEGAFFKKHLPLFTVVMLGINGTCLAILVKLLLSLYQGG